jgi:hypothetical protein
MGLTKKQRWEILDEVSANFFSEAGHATTELNSFIY